MSLFEKTPEEIKNQDKHPTCMNCIVEIERWGCPWKQSWRDDNAKSCGHYSNINKYKHRDYLQGLRSEFEKEDG